MRSGRGRCESTSRGAARHGRTQIYKVLKKSEIPVRAFARLVVCLHFRSSVEQVLTNSCDVNEAGGLIFPQSNCIGGQ
jgi:hypothetical protein